MPLAGRPAADSKYGKAGQCSQRLFVRTFKALSPNRHGDIMNAVSRYQGIVLLPANALAALPPPRLEVRQRRTGSMLAGMLAMLITIAALPLAYAWYQSGAPLRLVLPVVVCTGGSALYGWICLRQWRRADASGGWVLREDGAHLLVNLRSHLNTHFDPATPSVLVLPRRRVHCLTIVQQHSLRPRAGDKRALFDNRARRVFLDIAFDGDREPIAAAIAAEAVRRGKTRFGSSRHQHSAVSMLPGKVLRVHWRDEHNRLQPALAQVRRALAGRYRFLDADAAMQTPIKTLERAEQEARLLDMVARGERLQAIALAKVLYGMETAEAIDFIDGLK